MELNESQIQTIIAELTKRLDTQIYDPDIENAEPWEDDYGRSYSCGYHTDEGMFEDILWEEQEKLGLKEEDEVLISCDYRVECSLCFEPYDPGDYWTPPSGGDVEINESEGYISDLCIDINIYNPETDDYDSMDISQEVIERIEEGVNRSADQNLNPATIKRRREAAERRAKYHAEKAVREAEGAKQMA